MSSIAATEKQTQIEVIELFKTKLGYRFLGDLSQQNNKNLREQELRAWWQQQGIAKSLQDKAWQQLEQEVRLGQRSLYAVNKDVYALLYSGVKVKLGQGDTTQTVPLIDWHTPFNNDFYLAEEVTVKSQHDKRPDLVVYLNGIAVAVIELKRSTVSVNEGIRQQIDNQKELFIQQFYTTMQLLVAANPSQGVRYGTIKTTESYYLTWQEEANLPQQENLLCSNLYSLFMPERLLELIHDFVVFDKGVKKLARPNQFFGIKAAQQRVRQHEGGIIWHTQGSGKSLTMVWLAKWILENIDHARVLVMTDRVELDKQIQGTLFNTDLPAVSVSSGQHLLQTLQTSQESLICALIHKFRLATSTTLKKKQDSQEAIQDLKKTLQIEAIKNFKAKGRIVVFIDECHRTHSGLLHEAMKGLLPDALFIGFTGTPLLKKDKSNSQYTFGSYIHTYKFDQAVADGVVLDLCYEARDIEQYTRSQDKIDAWFNAKTQGLNNLAKAKVKQQWVNMEKLLSSKQRLEKIAYDIVLDMAHRPRLKERQGNAMLVCGDIFQACRAYEIFQTTPLKGQCAVVSSYQPNVKHIKGQDSGEGEGKELIKYQVYLEMVQHFMQCTKDKVMDNIAQFEKTVTNLFIHEPHKMRLLIVVDKLLTGFDAPPATYLYIDKKMQNHNLFQAICRVNRLDGEGKDKGYIIDYKDSFQSLTSTMSDYTGGEFADFDPEDIDGLLNNPKDHAKKELAQALETIRELCQQVAVPRSDNDYYAYFCGAEQTIEPDKLLETENRRVSFYQAVKRVGRCYANYADQFGADTTIKHEVQEYFRIKKAIELRSGDGIDTKALEPAMIQMYDMYIQADHSETLLELDHKDLLKIVKHTSAQGQKQLEQIFKGDQSAIAETIHNNVQKITIEKHQLNPAYYEKMSALIENLIEQSRQQTIDLQTYMQEMRSVIDDLEQEDYSQQKSYPSEINSPGKQALYDNIVNDKAIISKLDETLRNSKPEGWRQHRLRKKRLENALKTKIESYPDLTVQADEVLNIAEQHKEYW